VIGPDDYDDCALIMADRLDRVVAEFTDIAAAQARCALPSISSRQDAVRRGAGQR